MHKYSVCYKMKGLHTTKNLSPTGLNQFMNRFKSLEDILSFQLHLMAFTVCPVVMESEEDMFLQHFCIIKTHSLFISQLQMHHKNSPS